MNLNGPIPGENYTSDTKNYPWHRPPEHADLDTAIEAAFKKLTEDDNAVGLLTMLEHGVTIADATSMFVLSGVGAGKWTPDFAVLLAGPVAHIIYLMAKGYGIDCDLGIDKKPKRVTSAFFNEAKKVEKNKVQKVVDKIDVKALTQQASGFMGMSSTMSKPMDTKEESEY